MGSSPVPVTLLSKMKKHWTNVSNFSNFQSLNFLIKVHWLGLSVLIVTKLAHNEDLFPSGQIPLQS